MKLVNTITMLLILRMLNVLTLSIDPIVLSDEQFFVSQESYPELVETIIEGAIK